MEFTPTEIPAVILIEPRVFEDERGFFLETYHRRRFREAGIECEFPQDNHSRSVRHTLRGLHFQSHPGQAKLMRATRGTIWDVAVDIRPQSPTFLRWVARELSEENKRMLFIPVGFAHGFVVLSESADVQYKCSHEYIAETESGFRWDDPDVGVQWPVAGPILSRRDLDARPLREVIPEAFPSD